MMAKHVKNLRTVLINYSLFQVFVIFLYCNINLYFFQKNVAWKNCVDLSLHSLLPSLCFLNNTSFAQIVFLKHRGTEDTERGQRGGRINILMQFFLSSSLPLSLSSMPLCFKKNDTLFPNKGGMPTVCYMRLDNQIPKDHK